MDITNLTPDTFILLGRQLGPQGTIHFENSEYGNPTLRDAVNHLYKANKISVDNPPSGFVTEGSQGFIVDPENKEDGDVLTYDESQDKWVSESPSGGSSPLLIEQTFTASQIASRWNDDYLQGSVLFDDVAPGDLIQKIIMIQNPYRLIF